MKKLTFFLFTAAFLLGCSKNNEKIKPSCDGSKLTYNSGISTIINSNCNNSGCHNSGSSNGDYTSYSGLSGVLNNGNFNSRVLNKQDMPKGSAILSQKQLNQLKCWINNSFPKN